MPSYFAKFLRKIQPSRSSRELASQLHKTLRQRLKNADDAVFNDWYSDSFLYGSYARNTAINPIKDVDVCILLDIDIVQNTPEVVVRHIKKVLENVGYEAKTAYQRRSVRIDMSKTTLDVVPVVPLDETSQSLKIPDRVLKSWVNTHPTAHMEAATRINKECGNRYIPLVKIVKAWYHYQAKEKRELVRPKPKGFTLETLVANYQDPDAPTYAEAFVNFLENFMRACGKSLKSGIFPPIPDIGMPGEYLKVTFSEDEAKLFANIIEETLSLAKKALEAETYGESASLWREIFGNRFPDAPTSTKSLNAEMMDEEELFDPLIEAEINETILPRLSQSSKHLKLKADLSMTKGGKLFQRHKRGGRALAKGTWIRFSIASINIQPPYSIRWTVQNHGKEALESGDMGHERETTHNEPSQWEHTKYRGAHHMLCEIIKSDIIVAQERYTVTIK